MHGLPVLLRLAHQPVILVGTGEAAEAKRRLLERAGAAIVDEADAEARLAIVAVDEENEAAAAVGRLRARGLLVNAVDRPALSDFTLPAIVDRDPVLVAISTAGVSAGLAAALRQRLEGVLPAGLGALAEALHAARGRMRARWPDAGERRRAIGALLAPGGPLDPFDSTGDVAGVIEAADAPASARLERILLRSPDPDELTLRAARLLGLADRVYHPAGMTAALLDRARADAVRIVGPPPALLPPGLSLELAWEQP